MNFIWNSSARLAGVVLAAFVLASAGCGPAAPGTARDGKAVDREKLAREIEAARAKLDPADRVLVEEQDFCAVMTDNKLGSMGTPYKVMIKGQPVFLCCEGCSGDAEDDPDKTLATVAALKAKKKQK